MFRSFFLFLLSFAASAQQGEWRNWGNDPGGMRFSPLKQIDRTNVARLKPAWTYNTGDLPNLPEEERRRHLSRVTAFEATPLYIDGVLYFSTPSSRVIALDAETGRELWMFDPESGRTGQRRMRQHRGVSYWSGGRILYGTLEAELIALDAKTGKPCADFGANGRVDLGAILPKSAPPRSYSVNSPPAIYKDLVIVGTEVPEGVPQGPSGMVRAFDVRTGELKWTFHTVPKPGSFGNDTWEGESWKDRTGVNVWSMMSVDAERGIVFLPLGSPAYDFYGGDRHGNNLFGNSLVALDAATGRRIWHYQLVHHDIWDYDLPAQPLLARVGERDAVVQVTKMGLVFVFDRETGKPLFPIEERPVPQSSVPGEATSPTQPFPVKPPPLSRTLLTRKDMSTVTPESQKYCTEFFDSAVHKGIYSPWALEMTMIMPGTLGGATWSGASFDPRTGLLYVNANEFGAVGLMKPQPEDSPLPYRRASPTGEYARFVDPHGWPCQQPPWGTLQAIDLQKGEVVWKVPLGIVEELAAKGLKTTGAPNIGGSIVTAGGLVFIAGTNDNRFRAFHSGTGHELWVSRIPASGHATPMTYTGKSGKQYVAIAAGGGGFFSADSSDALVAFALPEEAESSASARPRSTP